MFYDNSIKSNSIKYITKKITSFSGLNTDVDQNVLSFKYSPMCYNFNYCDGSLRDGLGLGDLKFRYLKNEKELYKTIDKTPDSSFIIGCWLFNVWSEDINAYRAVLVMYSSYGDFYYNGLHSVSTEMIKIDGLKFAETPIVSSIKIDGVDTLLLVSESDGMYIWQYPNIVRKIKNAPSISSLCVHNGRLFATTFGEKRRVIYSNNLDPTTYNDNLYGNGFIELADSFGKCNKVISFKGYLYVFRDFNIAKIVDYLNEDGFDINQIHVSNGRIYDKTVVLCGDKILYLASDGVYLFDGNKSKKINLYIDEILEGVDNSDAVAGYSEGYYYLSCRLKYNDKMICAKSEYCKNNALLRIDIASGEMLLMRGGDIIDIFVINDIFKSEVCFLVNDVDGGFGMGLVNMSGKYFNSTLEKVWRTPMTDLGYPNKDKLLKEISLETKQDIKVKVVTENEVREFDVKGKISSQSIKCYIRARSFSISIISFKEDNYISGFQMVVGVL